MAFVILFFSDREFENFYLGVDMKSEVLRENINGESWNVRRK